MSLNNTNAIKSYLSDETIVIPYWVRKVLKQNKLNYVDVRDYKKLRSIMSLEDIVDFYSCLSIFDDSIEIDSAANRSILNSVYETNDPMLITEFKVSILPLLHSVDVISNLRDRLSEDNPITPISIDWNDTYTIEASSQRVIFIFINKGFIDTLSVNAGKQHFLTAYLKMLYSFKPIHLVSKCGVFKEYVKTLQQ